MQGKPVYRLGKVWGFATTPKGAIRVVTLKGDRPKPFERNTVTEARDLQGREAYYVGRRLVNLRRRRRYGTISAGYPTMGPSGRG